MLLVFVQSLVHIDVGMSMWQQCIWQQCIQRNCLVMKRLHRLTILAEASEVDQVVASPDAA